MRRCEYMWEVTQTQNSIWWNGHETGITDRRSNTNTELYRMKWASQHKCKQINSHIEWGKQRNTLSFLDASRLKLSREKNHATNIKLDIDHESYFTMRFTRAMKMELECVIKEKDDDGDDNDDDDYTTNWKEKLRST